MLNPKMKIMNTQDGIEALRFLLPILQSIDYQSIETIKSPILDAISQTDKKN